MKFVLHSLLFRCISSYSPLPSRRSFSSAMKTIVVEGNIGSGKTNLINHFKLNHSQQIMSIAEPVSLWRNCRGHNLFNSVSLNPQKFAFPFQQYVQLTMSELHRQPLPKGKCIKLMERSLYSARHCFVENHHRNGVMNDAEFSVYDEYYKFLIKDNQAPVDVILYLKASPEVCLQRIIARNRNEENTIPLEYLQQLDHLHEEWIESLQNRSHPTVITIDANCNKEEMLKTFESLAAAVLDGVCDSEDLYDGCTSR